MKSDFAVFLVRDREPICRLDVEPGLRIRVATGSDIIV
jgi:hypothetical protein